MKQNKTTTIANALASATGAIEFGFTNDYMFRATLQQSRKVLKTLICALLHLNPEDVCSVEITNPIELGKTIDAKEFVLDIKVSLNNHALINLEMQLKNQQNWEERSLSYLCRSFDQLNSGEDYIKAAPAIHIGFLNFTPFSDAPEFYATYKLLNVKNHRLYSSKFVLSVIDLTKIDLATAEDKEWQIDHWARLFKAKTWEDLKMIAKENEAMQEASETLYSMHCEQTIRDMARAREDALRRENGMKKHIATLEADNERLSSDNKKLAHEVAEKNEEIERLLKLLEKTE